MKKIPSNDDEEVVWDATKAAFESVHLGATQIAFRVQLLPNRHLEVHNELD